MQVQNLRVYERRGLLEPDRTPGGTRLYTPADVEAAPDPRPPRRGPQPRRRRPGAPARGGGGATAPGMRAAAPGLSRHDHRCLGAVAAVAAALAFGLYRAYATAGSAAPTRDAAGRASAVERGRAASGSRHPWTVGSDLPGGAELGERATLLQFSSAFCAPCRADPTRRWPRSLGSSPGSRTSRSTPSTTSTWYAASASCGRRPPWSSTPPAARSRRAAGGAAQGAGARRARGGVSMMRIAYPHIETDATGRPDARPLVLVPCPRPC